MNESSLILVFNAALWPVFTVLFTRAWRKGKLMERAARQAWLLFFLCCLITLLAAQEVETAIDFTFDWLPLGIFVRSLFMLLGTHVYFVMVREVYSSHLNAERGLRFLGPLTIALGLTGLALYVLFRPISPDDVRYAIRAVRDGVMLLFSALMFVPAGLFLFRRERVLPMRFKNGVITVFFSLYSVYSVGSVLIGLLLPFDRALGDRIAISLQPLNYVFLPMLMVMLVPHRWLLFAFYPARLYTYYRLRRLEKTVARIAGAPRQPGVAPFDVLRPGELDFAIYQTAISILDLYPLVGDDRIGATIHDWIRALVAAKVDYAELVKGMAAISL